jgi:hypothetical protein
VNTISHRETILSILKDKKPKSVKQLMQMVHNASDLKEHEVIDLIQIMHSEGLINLSDSRSQPIDFRDYLLSNDSLWYWTMIIVGLITTSLVLISSGILFPLSFARNVLGLLFVLFLPGYSLMRLLFPVNVPIAKSRQLQTIERIVLSIGDSIVLVTIVGLFSYFAPWGLDLFIINSILLIITIIFSSGALLREYQARRNDYFSPDMQKERNSELDV